MKRQLRSSLSFLIALISTAISQQALIRHKRHCASFQRFSRNWGAAVARAGALTDSLCLGKAVPQ